ncbi:hypothetical protein JKG47_12065 [Acidithiobacillus sp. MC6.1]|nr:hypothetical protein [Acidithiobacillus sp. MC6.1]
MRDVTDGLSLPWTGYIWVNPPYGSSLPKWVNKAMEEGARGTGIIMLVPARTGTRWWHRALDGGAVPIFMRGRLKFWRDGKEGNAAPFDTALLTFGLDDPQVNDIARQIQGKL